MSIKAHANQMHDIRMAELGHDGSLHQEVRLGLSGGQLW